MEGVGRRGGGKEREERGERRMGSGKVMVVVEEGGKEGRARREGREWP